MDLTNYKKFLDILTEDINAMFEHQKDYIFCKEGCSYCCEYGEYPFSEIEFLYLIEAFKQLDEDTQNKIKENIKNIKPDEQGYYTCPFLIDKKCSVYKNRGIVCRTFGLLNKEADGRTNGPFCGKFGLNYSNVFDKDTKQLLPEVIEKNNYPVMPRVFNLNIDNIRNLDLVNQLGIEIGPQQSLLEWLNLYFS